MQVNTVNGALAKCGGFGLSAPRANAIFRRTQSPKPIPQVPHG